MVGRDYQRPDTAVPASYYQSRSAATVQAAGTRWWQGLNDATLNQLVAAGLAQNLSLDAARERLKAAEAALRGSGRAEQVGGGIEAETIFSRRESQNGSSNIDRASIDANLCV